jgi:RNA polymerase sigma factor (sigma-70 family)
MSLNDSDILQDLKEGHQENFIEIVNQYKNKVLSLCFSYTRDYQEAEDLSQEVFISLYRNLQSFRGDCSISTYIYRIALSKCLDFKRKRSIKGFLTGLFNLQTTETPDIDERNHIRQCILSLPEDLKTPVLLYYYMGLSQGEIGEILKVPQKTVEGRIYRAKKRLKKELEKGDELICSKDGIV